jgi:phospholipid/cholesterol/gamma-HCH transport system permease protein
VLIFAVVIILVHCYYGYRASGGPAGVGVAVGRSVRTTIVTAALLNFFIGFAVWGTNVTVRIGG